MYSLPYISNVKQRKPGLNLYWSRPTGPTSYPYLFAQSETRSERDSTTIFLRKGVGVGSKRYRSRGKGYRLQDLPPTVPEGDVVSETKITM